jgi:hypothetical protein
MRTNSRKNGSALLIVMGFVLVASILVAGALGLIVNNSMLTTRQIRMEQALHIAEAGVEAAAQFIVDQDAFLFANSTYGNASNNVGLYDYEIMKRGFRSFSITSTGTVNGVRRVVNIDEVYVPTFAKFGWWSQVNGVIYFGFGDVLYGHVHTDDRAYLLSNNFDWPIFNGELSSLQSQYQLKYDNAVTLETDPAVAESANVEFHGGFNMNTANGSMANVNWSQYETIASNPANPQGIYLQGRSFVTVTGDQMYVTNPNMGLANHAYTVGEETIVYVKSVGTSSSQKGYVYMDGGELDGAMTIYAENDIYIRDHHTYADNPNDDVPGARSNDKLGLVSLDDVWVHSTAPDDLEIYAAIMATGESSASNPGKFGVTNYSSKPPAGNLTVYGSVVQQVRGAVATANSSGIISGYAKDYYWDDRFEFDAPPYFPPLSEKIVLNGWSEAAAY